MEDLRAENTAGAPPAPAQSNTGQTGTGQGGAAEAPNPIVAEATAPIPASYFRGEAEAPPADTAAERPAAEAQGNQGAAPEVAPHEGESAPATDGGEGREKFIPRERFDQVNARAQELERQNQQSSQEAADWRETVALGLQSPQQLQAIRQEAAQYGFADAGSYVEAVQAQQRAQAEMQEISDRPDLTDEAKRELIGAKQLNLQTQQQLLLTRQAVAQVNQREQQAAQRQVEEAITSARQEWGVKELPKEFEAILRETPPHMIQTVKAAVKAILDERGRNAVAEYAAAKDGDRRIVPPEGRGGSAPPASAAPAQDVSKSSWASLLTPGRRS